MSLSLMMWHVSSWVKLPKPIGYAGLNFITWDDIFPFGGTVFVSLSTMPDFRSTL